VIPNHFSLKDNSLGGKREKKSGLDYRGEKRKEHDGNEAATLLLLSFIIRKPGKGKKRKGEERKGEEGRECRSSANILSTSLLT